MDNNGISEKLKALTAGKNRSAVARLRDIFDDIEAAFHAGVRRKDVHKTLNESGFEITLESFGLAIYRIRKERGNLKNKKTLAIPPQGERSTATPPSEGGPPQGEDENGFHHVLKQLAEQSSNKDPRRTT